MKRKSHSLSKPTSKWRSLVAYVIWFQILILKYLDISTWAMNLIVKSITRSFIMLNNMMGNEINSSTNTLITSSGDSLSHQSASNYHTKNYPFKLSLQKSQVWSDATWRRSSVFVVNFEQISHLVLVFLLLTLSR